MKHLTTQDERIAVEFAAMDPATMFLVYATLFRLAVIALGALCITLGYRLFHNVAVVPSKQGSDEFSAEMGSYRMKLRNAAP
jgi:hypothetical protein